MKNVQSLQYDGIIERLIKYVSVKKDINENVETTRRQLRVYDRKTTTIMENVQTIWTKSKIFSCGFKDYVKIYHINCMF